MFFKFLIAILPFISLVLSDEVIMTSEDDPIFKMMKSSKDFSLRRVARSAPGFGWDPSLNEMGLMSEKEKLMMKNFNRGGLGQGNGQNQGQGWEDDANQKMMMMKKMMEKEKEMEAAAENGEAGEESKKVYLIVYPHHYDYYHYPYHYDYHYHYPYFY